MTRLLLAVFVLTLLLPGKAWADRRDQKAAELYLDGVDDIKRGKFREGKRLIDQALARGATEPNEQQGSESRYMARPYLPYYWLGVAEMELGDFEKALINFEKDESFGVIKRWPQEFADLTRRRSILEKKIAGSVPAPVPTAPPLPAPSATPLPPAPQIALPTPTPFSVAETKPSPAPSLAVSDTRKAIANPKVDRLLLEGLEALARGDFQTALSGAAKSRQLEPADARPYALEAAVYTTRYILGGRRDAQELESARLAFSAWTSRSASRRPWPGILSQPMQELLK